MQDEQAKKYVKDLGTCLKKFDVDELNTFIKKHKRLFDKGFLTLWSKADYMTKKATLCKIILMRTDLKGKPVYYKALEWLYTH